MEKKNMRKIKAGAAIFVVLLTAIVLGSGPSSIADNTDPMPEYHDSVTVTLVASDDISGVAHTYFSYTWSSPTNEGMSLSETEYTEPFVLDQLGVYIVSYHSVDNAGNIEAEKTFQFRIVPLDTTAPVTEISIAEN